MFPPQKLSLHASNKVHVGRAGLATPATTQLYRKLIDFTRKGRFTAVELPFRFPFEIERIRYRLAHLDNESHAK